MFRNRAPISRGGAGGQRTAEARQRTAEAGQRTLLGWMTGVSSSAALLVLLLGSPAHAARSLDEQLDSLSGQLETVEARMDRLALDFTQRRGLIGAADARQRYEDAVYAYLIGEYESAAMAFFVLVESEALVTEALDLDSEWYLAECLFEMGNYATALDAYSHIIEGGTAHPFFTDAVRRELEVYGLIQDNDNFQDLYRKYILSGMVSPTGLIKYTVAKSFYRQGPSSYARAKGLFSELNPDNLYYSRARYFMGTILAAEGDLQAAMIEFEGAASVEPSSAATREVQELSWLALGRLSYELGDYLKATEYYQMLSSASDYYADQLYELVWTYIKQDNWAEALQAIEIFLIAFPDHRYTMQLQLIEGHLHMKELSFEKALVSYETVVDAYSPIQSRLSALEQQRDSAAQLFSRMSEGEAFDSGVALPAFALEMLVNAPEVSRAVEMHQELTRQRADVTQTQELLTEVEAALANSGESIGTFSRGRADILQVQDRALLLRAELVGIELSYLLESAPERYRPELRTLQDRYLLLDGAIESVQGSQTVEINAYQTHLDQVQEVQSMAFQVQQVAVELLAEAEAVRRQLEHRVLSSDDQSYVQELLGEVDSELAEASRRLERLQSDAVRRQGRQKVPQENGDAASTQRSLLARDYESLHRQLGTYWQRTAATDRDALFSSVTQIWTRMQAVEQLSARTRSRLDDVEGSELAQLRQRLLEERVAIRQIDRSLDVTTTDASALAAQVTQEEFGRLGETFADTIMRADVGIVDVYWLRKTQISDEAVRLRKERSERLEELDKRFNVIHQKLENQEQ